MLVHQKALDGNVKLTDGLVAHLSLPNTMPEWHWAMSLNQAAAVRTALEYFRSLQPHCMGAILWQLNDCWPVVSWAAVDGNGRKKPLWYAMRSAYADRLVTVQPDGTGLKVAAVNDTVDAWRSVLRIDRVSFTGEVLASTSEEVVVAPRGQVSIPIEAELATAGDRSSELLRAVLGDARALWFYAEYRDSALAPASFEATSIVVPGGVEVSVRASALTRDLSLLADVADPEAEVDAMLVTLLPGERVTFRVSTRSSAPSDRFLAPDVLRSANDLVPMRDG
jgi:beta-mannosidase